MQCETNVWGLRPGRAARSARHARRVGGWAAALAMVGGVAHPVRRCLVAGASCCERCGRRASPARRRRCKWAANAATARVPCAATAPMQAGRQCGVVVNVGGTPTQRHPQIRAAPSTQRHPNNTAIPNNEPAFAPEVILHRLKSCLSSAKSRNPMSPAH